MAATRIMGKQLDDLVVPAVVVVGGYLVVSRVLGYNPLAPVGDAFAAIGASISDWATDVLQGDPDAIGGYGNLLGWIGGPIGGVVGGVFSIVGSVLGAVNSIVITITPITIVQGMPIHISVTGLLANQPLYYGWREFSQSGQKFTASASGTWTFTETGPGVFGPSAGTYHIYIDQIGWGGKRVEKTVTIQKGAF